MTAEQLGKAFVDFVTAELIPPDILGGMDVDQKLIELQDTGVLVRARKDRKAYTDALIEALLSCTPEFRPQVVQQTDPTTAALALDRIHCGTQMMVRMRQARIAVRDDDLPPLPEFFRQLLLQKFQL